MLTFIILAGVAIVALFIGFFDIRLPLMSRNDSAAKRPFLPGNEINSQKKAMNEPVKSIEAFYRTLRVESWIHNIQLRSASEVA